MKKRIYVLVTTLLIALLTISPVYAGGYKISASLGASIDVDLTAWGVGNGAVAYFTATGVPYVWCQAPGNYNLAQGQNPSTVATQGAVPFSDGGKGKFSAFFEGEPDFTGWTGTDFGCPNDNWHGEPYFIEWQTLTVDITNSKGEWLTINLTCTTTYIPNYTPNDGSTFNDGTIECK